MVTAAGLSAALAGPALSAETWRAFNGMSVVPDPAGAGAFAVVSKPRAGAPDFWCAAGNFAVRRLGARPTDRVFVAEGRVPSPARFGRYAIAFTMAEPRAPAPAPGEGGDYTLHVDRPGVSLAAAQADGFCTESRRRLSARGLGGL